MRCKCCDKDNAKFWGDDFYCSECKTVIVETIMEDEEINEDAPDLPELWSQ
jgi:hypothetical protein